MASETIPSQTLDDTLNRTVLVNKVDEASDTADEAQNIINDEHFIRDLKRIKELRSFLIQEAINVSPGDSTPLSFGKLNRLQFGEKGREPTLQEWLDVERYTQNLFRLLTEPLRRRFILGGTPVWVAALPILLALVALMALIVAAQGPPVYRLPSYLFWLICLGAIGSIASIGMNALSVLQDITFDLTNRRLMLLRIALGALFGLVLTLPFGYDSFVNFISSLGPGARMGPEAKMTVTTQALKLLLPFVLGFSTSLVMVILSRLVDGVQAFFGRTGTNDGTVASHPSSSPTQPRARTQNATP